MLQPKRTKFRKMQKGRMKGLATRGAELSFGSFGIKSLEVDLDHQSSDRGCPYCGNSFHET